MRAWANQWVKMVVYFLFVCDCVCSRACVCACAPLSACACAILVMTRAPTAVEGCTPVGDSGLYVGGLDSAISMVEQGMASAEQFKFFYNQCEWVPGALEQECAQGLWRVGKIPSNLCLRQMASQSDRPMDNKLKRKKGSPGIPLWDLLR